MECLGEEIEGSGRKIFKDYENRTDRSDFVQSDCDPELLFNIKFSGDVKLKSIIVIGGDDDLEPTTLKMFKNKEGLSFDDVQNRPPEQEIELVTDPGGEVQYPLKTTKFNNVHHLSLFFPESKGEDQTRVSMLKSLISHHVLFLVFFLTFCIQIPDKNHAFIFSIASL